MNGQPLWTGIPSRSPVALASKYSTTLLNPEECNAVLGDLLYLSFLVLPLEWQFVPSHFSTLLIHHHKTI